MAKIKIHTGASLDHTFYCPGCKHNHGFKVEGNEPNWKFNGDFEKPTVKPSIKVTTNFKKIERICHFHLTDGKIEYCGDCWHDLNGKTVDMIDL